MALPRLIDVSNHQGIVSWDAVAASGIVGAFSKCTEGAYYRDPYFSRNWSEMKRVNLLKGAYHFARPSSGTPDAEAAYFLDAVDRAGGLETGDILVLDLEDTNYHGGGSYGSAGAWALGFCQYLEEAVGFAPVVYWAPWYRPDDIAAVADLANYPLWIAAYQVTMPPAPAPWSVVSFWQHSSTGRVPGVNGDCDLNVFNGPADRIALLGKPAPEEPGPSPYAVGPGILAAMADHGDVPATDEVFFKQGDRDEWSEAHAQSGARYVYHPSSNRVFHYPAA